HKVEAGVLTIVGKSQGLTILLEAFAFASKQTPTGLWNHLAITSYEKQDRVRVTRRIDAPIEHESFVMSARGKMPETATLAPQKPFTGRAVYSRDRGSLPSWTGDLGIELPSAGWISLTGPNFSAALCRGSSVAELKRCPNNSKSDYSSQRR